MDEHRCYEKIVSVFFYFDGKMSVCYNIEECIIMPMRRRCYDKRGTSEGIVSSSFV